MKLLWSLVVGGGATLLACSGGGDAVTGATPTDGPTSSATAPTGGPTATTPPPPPPRGSYTVGGTVSGLTGSGLVLQNNGGDSLPRSSNGSFTFATTLPKGASYDVTVLTQPAGDTCAVTKGTGTVSEANVSDLYVQCVPFLMGGARQGVPLNLSGTLTTLAGTPTTMDATGASANFSTPTHVVKVGGSLFVADTTGNTIRQIVLATGAVTTLAGNVGAITSADGVGALASFQRPHGITSDGTNLYVAEEALCKIRRIVLATGAVTTLAGSQCGFTLDGTGAAARFVSPRALTTDGTHLYVAEGYAIRKIVIASGVVTTLAGGTTYGSADGMGVAAQFDGPSGITISGANLFVADSGNHTLRKVSIATGNVATMAGTAGAAGSDDGIGSAARFRLPYGISTDGADLFVADSGNNVIRRVVLATGDVTTLAGSVSSAGSTDAVGPAARFKRPYGITVEGTDLYVTDSSNLTIRKIVVATGAVTTFASTPLGADGVGAAARFQHSGQLTTDGVSVFVAESALHTVRKIVIATGAVTTIAGSIGVSGSANGAGPVARFQNPTGITTDGVNLYVADSGNNTIRKIVIATAAVTTFAGSGVSGAFDGTGQSAQFNNPRGITMDAANLYVADTSGHTIRKIVIATGVVTTLAGGPSFGAFDGTGTSARFAVPYGITTDGTDVFVADSSNNTIRKIVIATGVVSTVAGKASAGGGSTSADGTGSAARFWYPQGITSDGTHLYVTDSYNRTVRKIVIATGAVTTLAGSARTAGVVDGTGTSARFWLPWGITTDGSRLLIVDSFGGTVRSMQ